MANSYFFFELPKFDFSLRKSLIAPKKIYIIDTAFNQIAGFNFSPNTGKNLENVVFVELKRRKNEIYYFAEKNECDFVVKDGAKVTQAIQVCYNLNNNDTKSREIRALLKAGKELKCKNLIIINSEKDEEKETEWFGIKAKIKIIPLWKWLLQSN